MAAGSPPPSKDSSDFMLEEYSQIAQSFFSLYAQLNQILQTYLGVMAAGAAAFTFLLQVLPKLYPGAGSASDLTLLGALLAFLGLLGIMAFFALIGIRLEMLLYARTINRVRAYFEDRNGAALHEYLVLPTSYSKPPYYEGSDRYFFWVTLLVGTINSVVISAGILLVSTYPINGYWLGGFLVGVLAGVVLHWRAYRWFAQRNEKHFKPHSLESHSGESRA
jgi:hypothetical protein